jgi:hypothetical protein
MDPVLRELKDRQEILDCLARYCRGMDRFDADLVRSAYHPDAVDDHGPFSGSVEGLIAHVFAADGKRYVRTQHILGNHSVELAGDTAWAETYWMFLGVRADAPADVGAGRYVDRFERRDGRWAIAHRVSVTDYAADTYPPEVLARVNGQSRSRRDRSDPSYLR